MILEELLGKPVWQMTGEDLLFLARNLAIPPRRQAPPKNKDAMCTDYRALLAFSDVASPPPTVSNRVARLTAPSRKWGVRLSWMQTSPSNLRVAKLEVAGIVHWKGQCSFALYFTFSVGYICLLMDGVWMSRLLKNNLMEDVFNMENESLVGTEI